VAVDRDAIPRNTRLKVRQRCGFGCVICGNPIYEYDHMLVDYSEEKAHKAKNLTLLCPGHHVEKTKGFLPRADVVAANRRPFNRQSGQSAPYKFRFGETKAVVFLGDQLAIEGVDNAITAIMIDGVPLVGFSFEDGHCLLQMTLFDEDDNEVLTVVDNELTHSVDTWDFEWVGTELTVRSAHRKILIKIRFEPPNRVSISRANLFCHAVEVEVWPELLAVLNIAWMFTGFTFRAQNFTAEHGTPVFLGLGNNLDGHEVAFRQPVVRREGFDRKAIRALINAERADARAKYGMDEPDEVGIDDDD
jgi:hypothetical protein